ncbi:MAG: HIRAN domain-containing protein [Erythrobacter sp.]|nr:HIRAN domain-containing protein [Erythrobacter sp.]
MTKAAAKAFAEKVISAASATFACGCGARWQIPLIEASAELNIHCRSCSHEHQWPEGAIADLHAKLEQTLRPQFEKIGVAYPEGRMLQFFYKTGKIAELKATNLPTVSHSEREGGDYLASIVGESFYQPAIRTLSKGEAVAIVRETGNPYDHEALGVRTFSDETIGYLPRDAWLRRALISEGRSCDAWIAHVTPAKNGLLGVVLGVELTEGPCEHRPYKD